MTRGGQSFHSPRSESRGATAAQLRADIDSGRTGDKVAAVDHAAAPLGTDEEAAGTPVPPEIIAETRQSEFKGNVGQSPARTLKALTYRILLAGGLVIGLIALIVSVILTSASV